MKRVPRFKKDGFETFHRFVNWVAIVVSACLSIVFSLMNPLFGLTLLSLCLITFISGKNAQKLTQRGYGFWRTLILNAIAAYVFFLFSWSGSREELVFRSLTLMLALVATLNLGFLLYLMVKAHVTPAVTSSSNSFQGIDLLLILPLCVIGAWGLIEVIKKVEKRTETALSQQQAEGITECHVVVANKNGEPAPNVAFALYTGGGTYVFSGLTDAQGRLDSFPEMYDCNELKAIHIGSLQTNHAWENTVILLQQQAKSVTVELLPQVSTGSCNVLMRSQESSELAPNIPFALYDSGGSYVFSGWTDDEGRLGPFPTALNCDELQAVYIGDLIINNGWATNNDRKRWSVEPLPEVLR